KDVREHLHLRAGDRIEFVLSDGELKLHSAARKVTDLKGFLPKPKRRLSLAAMNDAIRKHAR
ncbi:MAG: AbrB/MazE/SpoVT family DNA-binding domain-containing protein, partial [Rhodanobacteraceae bacterium]